MLRTLSAQLARFRWWRRLLGGTWRRGDQVERYPITVGAVSRRWLYDKERSNDGKG